MPAPSSPIEAWFADYFAHWQITLPPADVRDRRPGHIFARRWHIGYIWGEQGTDEFIELLCQHRMTDDRHLRAFASGRVEDLPSAPPAYGYGPNATDTEIANTREERIRLSQQISAELRQKGLLPPHGANLPSLDINEYLRSGGDAP